MTEFKMKQSVKMVLHNLELLERILQYLSKSKQTLVSASLTAKAFSEPAFNVLWYEMSSIWPLFRILPAFERAWNGKYEFTGPIHKEHLQRVLYYAKRIRFLNYEVADNSISSWDLVILTFMRMDELGAFFPLRNLKIDFHDVTILSRCNTLLLPPLSSPNLDSILIRTNTTLPILTEIGLVSFLHSVAQSRLLRSCAIDGTFRDITLQVLPNFVNLHRLILRLESSDIPVHFLKRFASSIPSLRDLHIHISNCRFAPRSNDGPQGFARRYSFPSLETLYVGCDSIHLEDILGVLNAPLLKSASLMLIQSEADGAHMQQFLESNRVLKDKVHRLVIKTIKPSLTQVESFDNLRELVVLSLHGTISMSDIVGTFDGSWSRFLVHLQLMQMHPINSLNCISIAALWVIADTCPNLEFLEISIHRPDKPEMQIAVKQNRQERKPHNLKKLVFFNLPRVWNDTKSLATDLISLLDYLFPFMTVPKYIGATPDKPGARAMRRAWWNGVVDMWQLKKRKSVTALSV